jgi:hypothetical protein
MSWTTITRSDFEYEFLSKDKPLVFAGDGVGTVDG